MRLLLLITLLCGPQIAFSQTIDCLPPAQRIKIADSLRALPQARLAAAQWRRSSDSYRKSAESFRAAGVAKDTALAATERAFNVQQRLTANQFANAEMWKRRARRRGLLNWLGLAVAAGAGYLLLTH